MEIRMAFTHLHVHTEYSLLDGLSKINEIVAQAKKLGMDSLAITDHGVMYGVIDFYRAALKEGIKPIIGCEVYVAPGSRFDKEAGAGDDRYYHLVLLAENGDGFFKGDFLFQYPYHKFTLFPCNNKAFHFRRNDGVFHCTFKGHCLFSHCYLRSIIR